MASITSIIQGGMSFSCGSAGALARPRGMVVVRAEAINPGIKKEEPKVVHSVEITDLSMPETAYCRCWRSKAFPLCDNSHLEHNKTTGDNVGPLLLKKLEEAVSQ